MSSVPREKKIVVIGDAILCLIGAAAGADYYVFKEDCSELENFLEERIDEYGVLIIGRNVVDKCRVLYDRLMRTDVLTIVVDPPKVMREIDPKKYYEDLITKFVGMKISL